MDLPLSNNLDCPLGTQSIQQLDVLSQHPMGLEHQNLRVCVLSFQEGDQRPSEEPVRFSLGGLLPTLPGYEGAKIFEQPVPEDAPPRILALDSDERAKAPSGEEERAVGISALNPPHPHRLFEVSPTFIYIAQIREGPPANRLRQARRLARGIQSGQFAIDLIHARADFFQRGRPVGSVALVRTPHRGLQSRVRLIELSGEFRPDTAVDGAELMLAIRRLKQRLNLR